MKNDDIGFWFFIAVLIIASFILNLRHRVERLEENDNASCVYSLQIENETFVIEPQSEACDDQMQDIINFLDRKDFSYVGH